MRSLSGRARRRVESGSIGVALAGLVAMVQPFSVALYTMGFPLLLLGGLAYISTTFWNPSRVTLSDAARLFLRTLLVVGGVVLLSIGFVAVLL